jgi:uncharacterized membrane protein HdeD (DUF308 family)
MDFSQFVVLGGVLAGVTELISRLRARDFWVVATIVSCAVVGAIFGYFHWGNVPSVEVGLLAGLFASGAIKTISSFGNKSTPAPSTVLTPTEVK